MTGLETRALNIQFSQNEFHIKISNYGKLKSWQSFQLHTSYYLNLTLKYINVKGEKLKS